MTGFYAITAVKSCFSIWPSLLWLPSFLPSRTNPRDKTQLLVFAYGCAPFRSRTLFTIPSDFPFWPTRVSKVLSYLTQAVFAKRWTASIFSRTRSLAIMLASVMIVRWFVALNQQKFACCDILGQTNIFLPSSLIKIPSRHSTGRIFFLMNVLVAFLFTAISSR